MQEQTEKMNQVILQKQKQATAAAEERGRQLQKEIDVLKEQIKESEARIPTRLCI